MEELLTKNGLLEMTTNPSKCKNIFTIKFDKTKNIAVLKSNTDDINIVPYKFEQNKIEFGFETKFITEYEIIDESIDHFFDNIVMTSSKTIKFSGSPFKFLKNNTNINNTDTDMDFLQCDDQSSVFYINTIFSGFGEKIISAHKHKNRRSTFLNIYKLNDFHYHSPSGSPKCSKRELLKNDDLRSASTESQKDSQNDDPHNNIKSGLVSSLTINNLKSMSIDSIMDSPRGNYSTTKQYMFPDFFKSFVQENMDWKFVQYYSDMLYDNFKVGPLLFSTLLGATDKEILIFLTETGTVLLCGRTKLTYYVYRSMHFSEPSSGICEYENLFDLSTIMKLINWSSPSTQISDLVNFVNSVLDFNCTINTENDTKKI